MALKSYRFSTLRFYKYTAWFSWSLCAFLWKFGSHSVNIGD